MPVNAKKPSNVAAANITKALALQAMIALALTACKRENDAPAPAPPTAETAAAVGDGPNQPPADLFPNVDLTDPDLVVAEQGDLTVTLDDVRYAIAWREASTDQAIEEVLGEDWIDNTNLVASMLHQLLGDALLRADAQRFGLSITDAEYIDALSRQRHVRDLATVPDEVRTSIVSELGLTDERLRQYITDPMLMERWIEHRLSMITDDDRFAAFARRNTTVGLDAVIIPNTFSPQVIQDTVQARAPEIETYYGDRPSQFIRPARAQARVIRVPIEDDEEAARAEIEALRERALAEGTDAVIASSTDHSANAPDHRRWVSERELPPVVDVPVGEIGEINQDRNGFYFAETFEIEERTPMPLDATLRQDIARRILRAERVSPATRERADTVVAAMRDGTLDATLAEHNLRVSEIPPFPYSRNNNIPIVGQAEPLMTAAYGEDVQVGDVLGPIHTHAGVVVAKVREQNVATREIYEAERDAFRVTFDAYLRDSVWPARLAEVGEEDVAELHVALIQAALKATDTPDGDGSGHTP